LFFDVVLASYLILLPQYIYLFDFCLLTCFEHPEHLKEATSCRNRIQTVFLCLLQSNQLCCLGWQTVICAIWEQAVNWHLILSTDSTACSIFAFSNSHLMFYTSRVFRGAVFLVIT